MALYSALYSGMSGLATNGLAMSIVGDNLANLNTIGFKKSRANFQDMLGFSVVGPGTESFVGRGSSVSEVEQVYTQGSFMNTGNGLDLAITGSGFFVVNGSSNGMSGNFYSRDGQFHVDNNGNLVNTSNMIIQGYNANESGNISSALGDLNFSSSTAAAKATAEIDIYANLDSSVDAIPAGFDVTDIDSTSNFSTTISVYDSLGAAHETTVYFTKTADNNWEWNAVADGGDLTGGTEGTPEVRASGTMSFTADGELQSMATTTSDFDFVGGSTANQAIAFNFGDDIASGGTGLSGCSQYASASNTSYQSQDGYTVGELASVIVDADGVVTGMFSNGERKTMGQVAVAKFQGDGLRRLGGNIFSATTDSGEAVIGGANTGGRGSINANVLESSNVDLASEFGNMIVFQRAYQANSRTISTTDQMIQELLSLKR